MFDKLLEFIIQMWQHIVPFVIINQYEEGALLRFGILKKNLKPGLHFKIPLADTVWVSIVTTDTLDIKPVNITTTDNKTISVGAVLEFEINDIIKFLIYTNEAKSNAHDICRGIMADHLTDCTWEQCKDKKTIKTITKLVKTKCDDMGIHVKAITFTDMSMSRVIKLFADKNTITDAGNK